MVSAQPTTTASRRSRRLPSTGGIGAGCSKFVNAAASRSLALEKCRYRVARATLAVLVTASMVTALGPPVRSSVVAASSNRARDRAGLGSPVMAAILTSSRANRGPIRTRLSVSLQDC